MLQAPIDPPEPKLSSLTDYQGYQLYEGTECLSLDGFNIPREYKDEFLEWFLNNYRHEAKEYLWEIFEETGSYIEA